MPGKADKIRFPVFPEDATANENRRACSAQRIVRRADGGRHRPAVPPALQALRRRLRGQRDGVVAARAARVAQDPAARRPRRRARPDRGADRRHRPGDDGRGRAPTTSTRGAQIIDINMGCPAKKVCNVVGRLGADARTRRWSRGIVEAVVAPARRRRAGDAQDPHRLVRRASATRVRIARIAEARRHRRCSPCTAARASMGYSGHAEYDTIAAVKPRCASRWSPTATSTRPRRRARCSQPPAPTRIMIGRAAQGRPWIFREIAHFLATGERAAAAARRRGRARAARAPRRPTTRSTARSSGVRMRAQAHRLDGAQRCPAARRSAHA